MSELLVVGWWFLCLRLMLDHNIAILLSFTLFVIFATWLYRWLLSLDTWLENTLTLWNQYWLGTDWQFRDLIWHGAIVSYRFVTTSHVLHESKVCERDSELLICGIVRLSCVPSSRIYRRVQLIRIELTMATWRCTACCCNLLLLILLVSAGGPHDYTLSQGHFELEF